MFLQPCQSIAITCFLGDFNLHVSNTDDTDPAIFNDSIDAMGLYQHVGFSTHKSGNILDLILSDITDNTKVLTTAPGSYLMDHRVVIATLNVKTHTQKPKVRTIRKLDKVAYSEWTGEFNPNNIPLTYKLDNLVESLDTELTRILNELAPEKKCTISTKPKQPWYDEEAKILKRKIGKLEKKWLKYKVESCWSAYKKARNSYYGVLNRKKKATIRHKIEDCTGDSRKLHALVNNLTSKSVVESWPEHTTKAKLEEEFADFLENKILNIWEQLIDKPKFTPSDTDTPQLSRFAPLTEDQVQVVIGSLRSKSCELDAIPTTILKKNTSCDHPFHNQNSQLIIK